MISSSEHPKNSRFGMLVFYRSLFSPLFPSARLLREDTALTGAVAESGGREVVGEGLEMLRLDLDHGGPREGHVILHVGLGHGLVHQRVGVFHLRESKPKS